MMLPLNPTDFPLVPTSFGSVITRTGRTLFSTDPFTAADLCARLNRHEMGRWEARVAARYLPAEAVAAIG